MELETNEEKPMCKSMLENRQKWPQVAPRGKKKKPSMCTSYSSWQWNPEANDSLSMLSGNLSLLILRPEDQQKGERNLKKKRDKN